MNKPYPSKRIIKKRLHFLEGQLGEDILAKADYSIDFWVSYYVTWLLRYFYLSKDLWCDGAVWEDDKCLLEFVEIGARHYKLKCQLDLLADDSTSTGELNGTFEFTNDYCKFKTFNIDIVINGELFIYSSK